MESIDLNIDNYTFEDLLQLFKLKQNYDIDELIDKKNILIKIKPDNSQLDKKYYNFFLKAYNVLNENLNEQIALNNKKKLIEKEKEFQDNAFIQKYIIVNDENKNSCYKPYDNIF